jgi:hypothetical protein
MEIQRAVRAGYKVIKIYEVWHFKETVKYNSETKEGGFLQIIFKKKLNSSRSPAVGRGVVIRMRPSKLISESIMKRRVFF